MRKIDPPKRVCFGLPHHSHSVCWLLLKRCALQDADEGSCARVIPTRYRLLETIMWCFTLKLVQVTISLRLLRSPEEWWEEFFLPGATSCSHVLQVVVMRESGFWQLLALLSATLHVLLVKSHAVSSACYKPSTVSNAGRKVRNMCKCIQCAPPPSRDPRVNRHNNGWGGDSQNNFSVHCTCHAAADCNYNLFKQFYKG